MINQNTGYSRIIKASSATGGAQLINMLIGMVRIKFVAVLIGPVGVGLLDLYRTVIQVLSTLVGLGLKSSAVRDISKSNALEDNEQVGKIYLSLRRMCWFTGAVGGILALIFSRKISQLTFGSPEYTFEISGVGLAVFILNIQAPQAALLQGVRRVGDLAKSNVISSIIGTVISVGLYYCIGVKGIVPALISLAIIQYLVGRYYVAKISMPKVSIRWVESFSLAGGMLRLGVALMWNGLLAVTVLYLARIIIGNELSLHAVGIYAAAFALSGMVVNFVLGAMAADYYPSLTALSEDHEQMRDLVNRQTEIGLLLAMPGLLSVLALAPNIVSIFYSSDFSEAAQLLRWFVLGCIGRVLSWPLGFVLLAKGEGKLMVVTETSANLVHLLLILLGLHFVGLVGTAVAFFILYIFHLLIMRLIVGGLISFEWSWGVLRLFLLFLPVSIIAFFLEAFFSSFITAVFGVLLSIMVGLYCVRGLALRLGCSHRIVLLIMRIPYVGKMLVAA